ncbi:MAG TPA: VOC family protein [Acidimicrobiales bacterium]|nr:VOC family protein [Acidimicrobiales bacterium]
MASLKQLVVDCRHPAALARFWAAALDDFEIRPYDDAEVERLASVGRTPETDPGVILDGPNLEICFQESEPTAMPKKPMHVDVASTRREAEVQKLVALGGQVVATYEGHTWMRDPEGNDFCVVDA